MKKKLALLLALTLVVVMSFAACGGGESSDTDKDKGDGAVKTGLAVATSVAKSEDAGDENGLAQTDSVAVAVTVDAKGTILKCSIDTAQTQIEFDSKGKLVTPLDTVFQSKQTLGEDYGMIVASSIDKEWNEQASALADYVVGKTVDEVKGIAVNEEGVPTDEDLTSSVTIHIGEYQDAIEKAVANAQDLGAGAEDTLGLGIVTSMASSTDAGDEDGLAQAYTYYSATTFDADGVITSSIIDASQTNINFDKEGKITTDLKGNFQTKEELGEEYGMAAASSIGKEWNEQAKAFADYIIGKTVKEVNGISLKEGVPSDEDLASSVTIHVTDFLTILDLASASAK